METRTAIAPRVPIALLYRRVSTDDQAREGLSLGAQTASTRRYAIARGWTVGGEYEDVLSGTRDDRPRYRALLDEASRLRAGGSPVVVVVKWLDRFGRSVFERARSADELRKLQVPVHSVMEGGQVPELVANLLAAVAEEEVRLHGARMVEARRFIREKGWHFPARQSWGYRLRPPTPDERALGAPRSVLDIAPDQAEYAREAWRRAARGDSFVKITQWVQGLTDAARGGRRLGYREIHTMFKRPVYVSRPTQGLSDVLARPVMRWPALVDDDDWARVQARFREPWPQSSRKSLLAGLLRCHSCGSLMYGTPQLPKRSKYTCRGRLNGADARDPNCYRSVSMPKMDAMVLDEVRPLLAITRADQGSVAEFRRAWQEAARPAVVEDAPGLTELDERATEARRRWKAAALAFVDGRSSKARYERFREEALSELEAAESTRRCLMTDTSSEALPDADEILALAQEWQQALDADEPLAKRQTLARLIERVVPVRHSFGKYTVAIEWTPIARTLGQCISIRDHGDSNESARTEQAR